MDPELTQDNPAPAAGTADNNAGGTGNSLTDIMGSMAQNTAPDAKPEAKPDEGKKAEGTEKSQAEAPAWTSQLPEELRGNADVMKQLGKFNKIGDLAKSYSELESKIGNSIVRPGKDASPEDVNAFYQKLGKPETADKYTIDDENAGAYKELAYKNNLTDEQAKGMYQALRDLGEKAMAQNKEQLMMKAKATEDALKKEYGNDYQTKLELCRRGVVAYGGPGLGKKLQDTGLLFDEDVVRMFIKLGSQNAEAGSTAKSAKGDKGYQSTADGGSFNFKGI